MTADDASSRLVRDQINNGPGAFIAGDNYGRIEAIDAKTKELLVKITRQAPDLGRLLQESLRRGYIDSDVASMVAQAARSINEDVAVTLRQASLSLNEDVAVTLMHASLSLNGDVANRIAATTEHINATTAQTLADAATTLERVNNELDLQHIEEAAGQVKDTATALAIVVKSLNEATTGIEQAAAPFQRFTVSLRTALGTFVAGALVGAITYAHVAGR